MSSYALAFDDDVTLGGRKVVGDRGAPRALDELCVVDDALENAVRVR